MKLIDSLRAAVGAAHVLDAPDDVAPYATDWRGNFTGVPLAVVRPGSTAEVAQVIAACAAADAPVVPQAGNTGLVLGSVPDGSGRAVVVSVSRLNRLRAIDLANNTLTVEAGMILQRVQETAAEHGRLYAVSLAAEGSCEIGGTIATNAGGVQVLRYGNTREQVLGLEVVLPDGRVWEGLRGLRKDNTGYDLKRLFIGSEGTLGIITAATLKLWPRPQKTVVAMAALPSIAAAVELLKRLQAEAGDRLTAFEAMHRACFDLLTRHVAGAIDPFAARHPWYALLELSDTHPAAPLETLLETALGAAFEAGLIVDAVVAGSEAQAAALWNLREHTPEAEKLQGKGAKHDISLPISRIPAFVEETDALLQAAFPGVLLVNFGHLGDGNLHYNCTGVDREAALAIYQQMDRINDLVYDQVHKHGGSISAEHGLGRLKRPLIGRYKSALELDLMRAVKRAFDPLGRMNPGVML